MLLRILLCKFILLLLLITIPGLAEDVPNRDLPKEVFFLIEKAGNADSDQERLRYLKKIQEIPGLNTKFREELDTLVKTIEKWTHDDDIRVWSPFHPLFSHWYEDSLGRKSHEVFEDSPLYTILIFYKARWIVWHAFQKGGIWKNLDRRKEEFSKAREWFKEVVRTFPENRIARMYLGQPYPFDIDYFPAPGAPPWAIYQRELLERLTDIILWWIDNRQNEDGSYGGGWGDDVEMWRSWKSVMIAFQHPKIEKAQTRTSKGMMEQEQMAKGYTDNPRDVEHAAELSSDAISPMMFLRPEDQDWIDRALCLAELMKNVWTGTNQKGFLQFKSTFFSADSVILSPSRKACATVYEARAIQPLLLYWQRTGDPEAGKLLISWLDGWVNAAMSAERGKPEGVIPSAVHWPDGRIGGLGEYWWKPNNYVNNHPLYYWPSASSFVINSFLLGWYMTEDEKYLKPIRKMADIRFEYLKNIEKNKNFTELAEGSREWIGSKLTIIDDVCAKYKILTGSNEFDNFLKLSDNPFLNYRIKGEITPIEELLRNVVETLRYFFPAFTSEVRWTDAVYDFPAILSEPAIYSEPISTVSPTDVRVLYAMLTGEPSGGSYFPINAVRWLTLPRNIAVLVKESDFDRFEAELFHFGSSPRKMEAELYLLKKGTYRLSLIQKASDKVIHTNEIVIDERPAHIQFNLPSGKLCVLKIVK